MRKDWKRDEDKNKIFLNTLNLKKIKKFFSEEGIFSKIVAEDKFNKNKHWIKNEKSLKLL